MGRNNEIPGREMAEVVHESRVGRKEQTEAYYRVLNSILRDCRKTQKSLILVPVTC